MIINESRTVSLGDGSSAYSYGGKYYIKKGDSKKEISKDQYDKLLQKDIGSPSNTSQDTKEFTEEESELFDRGGVRLGNAGKWTSLRVKVSPKNGNVTVSTYGPMGFDRNLGTYRNFSKDALKKTLSKSQYDDERNFDVDSIDDSVFKNISSAVSKIKG